LDGFYGEYFGSQVKWRSDSMEAKGLEVFSLEGKVIIFTGALGIIGAEACDALAGAGANVVVADIVSQDACRKAAEVLTKAYGQKCLGVQVDISDKESVDNLVKEVMDCFGKIDVLTNCAAIDAKFDSSKGEVEPSSFEDYPIDIWKKSIDVNMTGLLLITQAVVKKMLLRKKGNIITVASTYSIVAPDQELYKEELEGEFIPKPIDYVATKSAVPNFTRYIAAYYGSEGIRANTIVPHGVFTDHTESFCKRFAKKSPLGRMCDVKELRGPFIFLASDASSYMTGSMLVVDGGWIVW
jgi:NAD(P)-dependent dehydrogenase (short-subunit alcohol dehydrogenase family)